MKFCIALLLYGAIFLFDVHGQDGETYLFSYFTGGGEDGLHLAYSVDGYTFKTLKGGKSFLKPTVGKDKLMRDPSIARSPDGTFHMVWTTGWRDQIIGYASSEDLITWSEQKSIPVMTHEKEAKNSWAPEVYFDDFSEQFIIIWSTTIPGRFPETANSADNGLNHRLYYVTTKDFETFSETQLFYDNGFNVIDGFIARRDCAYFLFLKDETLNPTPQKNIRVALGMDSEGPYGIASAPITLSWVEGPSAIQIGDEWFLYYDEYRNKKYGAVKSDDLENWEVISNKISFPKGARHGTVFSVQGFKINNSVPEGFELEKFVNTINGFNSTGYSIAPFTLNQTRSLLNIRIEGLETFNLTMSSATGRTVFSKSGKKARAISIEKNRFSPGLYFLNLQTNGKNYSVKTAIIN